jgi:hypothetical protein
VLPQVGPQAIPAIFLPDRPVFKPLTQDECDKTPITVKGKLLKYDTDWTAWADMADIAIQGYRGFIGDLFKADKK